jgi:hypothetical protein
LNSIEIQFQIESDVAAPHCAIRAHPSASLPSPIQARAHRPPTPTGLRPLPADRRVRPPDPLLPRGRGWTAPPPHCSTPPQPPLKGVGRDQAIFCCFPSLREDPPPKHLLTARASHPPRPSLSSDSQPSSVRSTAPPSPLFFGLCLTPLLAPWCYRTMPPLMRCIGAPPPTKNTATPIPPPPRHRRVTSVRPRPWGPTRRHPQRLLVPDGNTLSPVDHAPPHA